MNKQPEEKKEEPVAEEGKIPMYIMTKLDSTKDSIPVVSEELIRATGSMKAGYDQLKGTLTPYQVNIAQQVDIDKKIEVLETGIRKLTELTEKQNKDSKRQFYIATALAILGILAGVIIAILL